MQRPAHAPLALAACEPCTCTRMSTCAPLHRVLPPKFNGAPTARVEDGKLIVEAQIKSESELKLAWHKDLVPINSGGARAFCPVPSPLPSPIPSPRALPHFPTLLPHSLPHPLPHLPARVRPALDAPANTQDAILVRSTGTVCKYVMHFCTRTSARAVGRVKVLVEPPMEAGGATRTVLTIDDVLMSDAGLYRLIAKNADGESIASVMLNTDGAQLILVFILHVNDLKLI